MKDKRVKYAKIPSEKREIKHSQSPEKFYDKAPIWSFKKIDQTHEKWGLDIHANAWKEIIKKLIDFERQETWSVILQAPNNKRRSNTKNHAISIDSMIKEAQKRIIDLQLDEFDSFYSLHLTGTERLWGYIQEGIFYVIWYDQNHEICPSKKKHT